MWKLFLTNITVFCCVLSVNCQQITQQEAINAAVNTMKYNNKQSLTETNLFGVFTKQSGVRFVVSGIHRPMRVVRNAFA